MQKIHIIYHNLIAIIAAISKGSVNIEQAKYTVIKNHGAIEIRDYIPMIVAETEVTGDRKTAINKGFRIIADYIFGNNTCSQKVAMTAPVIQQSSEKIPFVMPFTQQVGGSVNWKVQFVMPALYTLATLPKPMTDLVMIKEIPSKRYVVIRFSGIADQKRLELEEKKLETFISDEHLTPIEKPIYAFFNPPWILPFLRRNEVMIEINK